MHLAASESTRQALQILPFYFLVCKQQTKQRDPKFPFEEHSPAFKLSRSYKLLVLLSRYILQSKYLPKAARECT